jgi:hypothetical protein
MLTFFLIRVSWLLQSYTQDRHWENIRWFDYAAKFKVQRYNYPQIMLLAFECFFNVFFRGYGWSAHFRVYKVEQLCLVRNFGWWWGEMWAQLQRWALNALPFIRSSLYYCQPQVSNSPNSSANILSLHLFKCNKSAFNSTGNLKHVTTLPETLSAAFINVSIYCHE